MTKSKDWEKGERKIVFSIVNQLFDLAEVSVEKRQKINDKADNFVLKIIRQLIKKKQMEAIEATKVTIKDLPVLKKVDREKVTDLLLAIGKAKRKHFLKQLREEK